MKQILLMVCILITVNTYSQPFASFEGTTKGFVMTVGFQSPEGIQIAAGYNVSITKANVPDLFYGNVGYNILLTQNDEDNFSLTPTIGAAHSSVQTFTIDDKYISTVKGIKPIYGLEFGKDWHMGKLFVSANYCGRAYYGIGIKAFIN